MNLYGTKLEETDKITLEKAMPDVDIDFRRGALLGIEGFPAGPAQVRAVRPGTAAEAADIRVKDVIQKFNGKPVASFEELTDEIRECREGDSASLEILRDGQTMEVKVTFGRWKQPEA